MTKSTLRKNHFSVFYWLLRNNPGLLDKYFPAKEQRRYTPDELLQISKNFTSRAEWSKVDNRSKAAAERLGCMEACTQHMHLLSPRKFTKEFLTDLFLKYKSLKELEKNEGQGAARAARKLGIIEDISKHFYRRTRKVLNRDTGKIYKSILQASKEIDRSDTTLREALILGTKCGGYHWAYCDENGKLLNERTKT